MADVCQLPRNRCGFGELEAWIAIRQRNDGARLLDCHRRAAALAIPARRQPRSARQRQRAGRQRLGGVGHHTVNDQRGKVGMMPAIAVTTMLT
jgi:hypothetical protein